MNQERFWSLLSKKLAAEASQAELQELEDLILQHPDWQYAIQSIQDIWEIRPEPDTLKAESAFHVHLNRMSRQNIPFEDPEQTDTIINITRPRSRRWYFAAAAILILALGWFGFVQLSRSSSSEMAVLREVNEISTRPGSKSRVELPDGSIVWLNAGSKLTYNKDFNQQLREVSLTGEAYFDVAKNKEKPFIIHTSTINVKVLGTVFNVKAYPQDKRTETSLIRGSVEVTIRNRPNDKIILSPSEKLIVENGNAKLKKQKNAPLKPVEISANIISLNRITVNPVDNTIAEIEWVNNRMVFRDETFEDLAVQMERWYNINIDISDESLKTRRLSGTFESETVTQALDALKFSLPFKYDQEGNKIFIHR